EELARRLKRAVELVIEKDKFAQGPIHQSMFLEALKAPVYIADLSGANPNVYLELGARWALRDHVTVLICQDIGHDVKFNVSGNRVILYERDNLDNLEKARSEIVAAICDGLVNRHVDSPVREALDVITIDKAEWSRLNREVEDLRAER